MKPSAFKQRKEFSLFLKILFIFTVCNFLTSVILFADSISSPTAKIAAADMLLYLCKDNWEFYADFTYYNLDGKRLAYAIVFKKSYLEIKTVYKIEESIDSARKKISSLL